MKATSSNSRIAFGFGLCLAAPLLVLGGANDWGLAVAVLSAVVVLVLLRTLQASARNNTPHRLVRAAWLTATGWTALHLVPLPGGILRSLSPNAAAVWTRLDLTLGDAPRLHPLSIDPVGTTKALLTMLIAAAFFETAAHVGRRHRTAVIIGVSVAVSTVAVIGVAHPALGLERLYGLYEPRDVATHPLSVLLPLLNPNHAAAAFGLALPLQIALAMESSSLALQLVLGVATLAEATLIVLTLSRGGIAVMALELSAMAVFAVARSRRRIVLAALAVGSVVTIVVAARFVAATAITNELADHRLSKLRLPIQALEMVRAYLWTGAGAGSFATGFPQYEGPLGGAVRFTHPECWPVQLLVDLGFPVAGLVTVLVGVAIARSTRLHSPASFGAFVALAGILVHDLFDFACQLPAVAALAATILGVVVAAGREHRTTEVVSPATTALTAAIGLSTFSLVALWMTWGRSSEDEARTYQLAWQNRQLTESSRPGLLAAMRRHPTESFFPMAAGALIGDGRLLVHAIALAPQRPQPHYWLARWLHSTGRSGQAWSEYRACVRLAPSLQGQVLEDMVVRSAPMTELASAAADAAGYDLAARHLDRLGRGVEADALDELQVDRYPPAADARIRRAHRALARGQTPIAVALLEAAIAAAPTSAAAYVALAALRTGDAAETLLERGWRAGAVPEQQVLGALILARGARLGLIAVGTELDRFRSLVQASDGHLGKVHATIAEVEGKRGQVASAVAHYREAAIVGADDHYLELAFALAEATSHFDLAIALMSQLVEAHPQTEGYRQALARVRAARPPALSPLP